MKRIVLYPFSFESEGYCLLRDTLREMLGEDAVLGVYPDGKYKAKPNDLIFDWGFTKVPMWKESAKPSQIVNNWTAVQAAVNKEISFAKFAVNGVEIPEFTTSAFLAAEWVSKEIPVVQRTKISSSKGKGASVVHCPQEFDPHAKLFTKLILKKREFRVHVFHGKVFDVHEKIYAKGGAMPELMVVESAEQDDAWTWQRSGVSLPSNAVLESVKAVKALGLDFGGVDVVTDAKDKAFVLEVNTAPWLGTTTVKKYAKEFVAFAK